MTIYTRLSGSQAVGQLVDRLQARAAARLPSDTTARATGTAVLLTRSADALAWSQVYGDAQVMAILLVVMVAASKDRDLGAFVMVAINLLSQRDLEAFQYILNTFDFVGN